MAAKSPSGGFIVVFGALKSVALLVGFVGTAVGLAAIVGHFTGNGWARGVGGVLGALLVPLLLVDRLLPENVDATKVRGLPTDVLSVVWMAFCVGFLGLGVKATAPLLLREAERERAAGFDMLSRGTLWVAGYEPGASSARSTASANPSANHQGDRAGDAGTLEHPAPTDAGSRADAATARRPERTPAELFRELAPAVVTVTVTVGAGAEGGGTGFLLDTLGTIATNQHVIRRANRVQVKLFDGTRVDDVELLDEDATLDLALLQIHPPPNTRLSAVLLGDSDAVQVGERAISIGNPLGLEHTLTDGLVSARRLWEGRPMIQMSVPVSPGNSGGPLFNMRGEVIGVTTAQIGNVLSSAQNLNMAVPVSALRRMLRSEYPNRRRYADTAAQQGRW